MDTATFIPVSRATCVTDLCGTVTSDNTANPGGTILLGDSALNERARGIYTFTLPTLPAGAEIVEALFTTRIGGGGGTPFPDLGVVVMDLVNVGTELTGLDFASGDRMTNIATLFTSWEVDPATVDVTDAIRADHDIALPRSSFRLRFTIGTDGDGVPDVISVYQAGFDPDLPRLEIRYRMP